MSLPSSQDLIQADDYNSLQLAVQLLLGTGFGSRGYGQPQEILSSQIVSTNGEFPTITKSQWNLLRQDIGLLRLHQTGSLPTLINLDSRLVVEPDINQNFNNVLNIADSNRFDLAAIRSLTSSKVSESFNGAWSVSASTTLTVNFSTPDDARFFFNAGGRVRFFSQRTGGSSTPQNSAWTTLLNNIGTISFGAITPEAVNFYSLTDQNQTAYEFLSVQSIYTNQLRYRIQVRSNISDNSNGGATQLTFTIRWFDDYTPGPFSGGGPALNSDNVDGTLSLSISETKAASPFVIESPLYSITSITAA